MPDDFEITVFGSRATLSLLEGLDTERVYDPDRIASYAVSTIGELLEALTNENGDEAPAILVNGRPITSRADIADYPAEAIARIETLPRGAAARVGGAGGQRVYNIVLKSSVRTLTLTGSRQVATDGGFGIWRGEALATLIKGQDRVNLAVRRNQSDALFESDRDLFPFADFIPFAPIGNIIGVSGREIDPRLSLLVGRPVFQAGVPALVGVPTLADFAATGGTLNPSNIQDFRTLRSAARRTEASISANKQIAQSVSASLNSRISTSLERGQVGLPNGRFLISPDNTFTPFLSPVFLALNDTTRPLLNVTRLTDFAVTAGLVADVQNWQFTTTATYEQQQRTFSYDQSIPLGFIPVTATVNPFAPGLAADIPVETIVIRNPNSRRELTIDMAGPLFALSAGTVRGRFGATFANATLTPRTPFAATGEEAFERPEQTARANLIVPLTRTDRFLGDLGNSDLTIEASRTNLGRFGILDYRSLTLNWQPAKWLRLSALRRHAERAPEPDLISGAVTVTQNVRYFDPVRNETVNVATISGGQLGLANETLTTTRLSADASVLERKDLHLTAEYLITRFEDQIGSTPPPTPAVVAAFPDRFIRDSTGRLTVVDTRPVNFDRQNARQLRFGVTGSFPLHPAGFSDEGNSLDQPQTTLQFSGSHTIVLSSTVLIRAGLDPIDLLAGGASGVGSARQRYNSDASIALSDRGTGFRLSLGRRGASVLRLGSAAAPGELSFSAVTKVDVRAFLNTERLFRDEPAARGGRITISFDNIANSRQTVVDDSGNTPFASQPAFRDPLGRTLSLEFRKVF